jgi:transcriptional regulator with XRE-family HTH domain
MKEKSNHGKSKMKDVGMRLKRVRESLGLNQRNFAKPLNFSAPYISQLENGTKKKPGISVFLKITEFYRISLDYLFHATGEMFLTGKEAAELGHREYIEEIETVEDLLWLMKRSTFFKHSVMGYAGKFKYEHDDIIKKSIDQYREKNTAGVDMETEDR